MRFATSFLKLAIIAVGAWILVPSAEAGWPRRAVSSCPGGQCYSQPVASYSVQAPVYSQTAPTYYPSVSVQSVGDTGGLCNWLNSLRAARGLGGVSLSLELCQDAEANSRIGFGHFFLGRARRQNVGWGNLNQVCMMWARSPAHAAALLDPSITMVGFGVANNVVTFSAR